MPTARARRSDSASRVLVGGVVDPGREECPRSRRPAPRSATCRISHHRAHRRDDGRHDASRRVVDRHQARLPGEGGHLPVALVERAGHLPIGVADLEIGPRIAPLGRGPAASGSPRRGRGCRRSPRRAAHAIEPTTTRMATRSGSMLAEDRFRQQERADQQEERRQDGEQQRHEDAKPEARAGHLGSGSRVRWPSRRRAGSRCRAR